MGVSDPKARDQHLEVWAVLKDGALTMWGLDHLCRFSVKSEYTAGCPVDVGELDAVGRYPTCLLSETKPRLTSICVSGEIQGKGTIIC